MAKSSERRDGPRIDLRLRVRYASGGKIGEAEASDVSPRGCRLESNLPVEAGTTLELTIDAGDDEELTTQGHVTWCRDRVSPSGKTLYDIGIAFSSEWLAQKRGPLGSALARIFAMNSYEPARNYDRTPVSLMAATSSAPPLALEIVDLSAGGMQLRGRSGVGELKTGAAVIVEITADGTTQSIDGKVVWLDGMGDDGAAFGVQFGDASASDQELLESVQQGRVIPDKVTVFLQG